MILGFSGWMDGGDVSTGTVEHLVDALAARELAEIQPGMFYIQSFPGSMEVSSLLRPHVAIEDGLVTRFEGPQNLFFCSEHNRLILFKGREPNLRWEEFGDCILDLATETETELVCFVGSVSGFVPHTKGPRAYGCASEEGLRPLLQQHNLQFSNYDGPGSFITYLMTRARERGLPMLSLVFEAPAYVQGRNPKCINAAAQKLAGLLDLRVDLGHLETLAAQFESHLDGAVRERPEIAELVRKMEEDYDEESSQADMDDLREWFEKQNIRLD
jgi:proteasome assembly chaperone (PAC2) family protein